MTIKYIENINIEEIIKDAKLTLFKYNINLLYTEKYIDDFMLWVVICHPKIQKSKHHLFLALILAIYLFIIDDIEDKDKNFNKLAFEIHNNNSNIIKYKKMEKIYEFIYYVQDLLKETLNLFNYGLLEKEILNYIESEIYKNENKIIKKEFNNIQEYLNDRIINICVIPFVIINLDCLGYNYPILYNNVIKNGITTVSIMQDIYSYEKEKDDINECYNAIKVIKKDIKIDDNIDILLNICKLNIIETCNIDNNDIKEILLSMQSGNALWGVMSKRYNFIKNAITKMENLNI